LSNSVARSLYWLSCHDTLTNKQCTRG
jgi:hypothetical protein